MNKLGRDKKFTEQDLYAATKKILVKNGYQGFTFSLLAKELQVSRATLYKYYDNKDELITNYMVFEMDSFLEKLKEIDNYQNFEQQFDFLINIIFADSEIHQIRSMAFEIPATNEKVKENNLKLKSQHKDMYEMLQKFVSLGKVNHQLKADLPDPLILGLIFQTVDIPNHFGVPQVEWIASIKEIIRHGMFTKD
ncbi:TetR/AcrR family transcriptional regulator [Oceanobacillus rekensis]|uniref:TetR/AcrR family transcriptional regulator n=1 Tax=Oceanobacillus rekensis TaxID=937927 RepID=UPI001FE702F2|nr:TetR/AcrR family transcriptional regulator [Oceanobacillus rekensis]